MQLSDAEYAEIQAEANASLNPEPAAETLAETAEVAAVSDEDSAAQETSDVEVDEETADEPDGETPDDEAAESEEANEIEPTDVPTAEDINTRFARVPKEARTEMIGLADRLRTTTTALDSIGGDRGAQVLKPLADIMQKGETTEDDRIPAMTALINANPATALNLMMDGAEALMQAPDFKHLGDKVVQNAFGASIDEIRGYTELKSKFDNATPEHIADLLKLEQVGQIDTETELEYLRESYAGSEEYQKQQEIIRELRAQVVAQPQVQEKQVTSTPALNEFESEFAKRFESSTAPAREMGKWGKDSFLAQMTTKAILADLKDDPDYKEAVRTIQHLGSFNADNLAVHSALNRLGIKARARYQEAVKNVNADFRKQSGSSANAVQAAKQSETKPKAVPLQRSNAVDFRPADDDLDSIWGEFRGMLTDSKAAAARSVG